MSSEKAEFHSYDELLETARRLLATGEASLYRAVVLEAITALETLIQSHVFELLPRRLPIELAKWLEEKTRMDFDSRLKVLAPVVTGQPVDPTSELWRRYKTAKEIRNKVTHRGRRVQRSEAEAVLSTVEQWIVFLGQTAGVELSLEQLRVRLERHRESIRTQRDVMRHISDFYRDEVSSVSHEHALRKGGFRPDLLLTVGDDQVAIEVVVVQTARSWVNRLHESLGKATLMTHQQDALRVALIFVFAGIPLPENFDLNRSSEGGRIRIIGVQLNALSR